jgi:hypothetical protein
MFVPQLTADGSFTFFSAEFGEAFHSSSCGRQEAQLFAEEPTLSTGHCWSWYLDVIYGLGCSTTFCSNYLGCQSQML